MPGDDLHDLLREPSLQQLNQGADLSTALRLDILPTGCDQRLDADTHAVQIRTTDQSGDFAWFNLQVHH